MFNRSNVWLLPSFLLQRLACVVKYEQFSRQLVLVQRKPFNRLWIESIRAQPLDHVRFGFVVDYYVTDANTLRTSPLQRCKPLVRCIRRKGISVVAKVEQAAQPLLSRCVITD